MVLVNLGKDFLPPPSQFVLDLLGSDEGAGLHHPDDLPDLPQACKVVPPLARALLAGPD